jgi:hypothetical protein
MNRRDIVHLEQLNADILKELHELEMEYGGAHYSHRDSIREAAAENIEKLFSIMLTVRGMSLIHRGLMFYKLIPGWIRHYLNAFNIKKTDINNKFSSLYNELTTPPHRLYFPPNTAFNNVKQTVIKTPPPGIPNSPYSSNSSNYETPPGATPSGGRRKTRKRSIKKRRNKSSRK